jgi:8-oxo-dGTP pyrophosphatase MutT (NUDIX family)
MIVSDGKILLVKCRNTTSSVIDGICPGDPYYLLPGGGQNQYETLENAVRRECMEETGYAVSVGKMAVIHEEIYDDPSFRARYPDYAHKLHIVFQCTVQAGSGGEPLECDRDQIGIEWVPLDEVKNLPVFPRAIHRYLVDCDLTGGLSFLGSSRVD